MAESEKRMLALILAAGLLVFASLPLDRFSPQLCLFKNFTGKSCPLCGFTRGVWFGLRGEPEASFSHHPFGWLLGTVLPFVCFGLAAPAGMFRGLRRFFRPVAAVCAVCFVLFGIIRIFLF